MVGKSKTNQESKAIRDEAELANLLAQQQEEFYLLFPELFEDLEKCVNDDKLDFLLKELDRRLNHLDETAPTVKVHPETLAETLKTLERCLEFLRRLRIQVAALNSTLHEDKRVRMRRVSRRRQKETTDAPECSGGAGDISSQRI